MSSTWSFNENVRIISTGTVGGPHEGHSKIKDFLDYVAPDLYLGQDTWEKAERAMLEKSCQITMDKAGLKKSDVDVFLAGDLLNQNITASFTARQLGIPFISINGACSTSMLSLIMGSSLVSSGLVQIALCGASSHNCAAEKQYRYPTEYGGQKPPSAQWTVTGAGTAIVGNGNTGPKVTKATIGKVIDLEISDPLDMGSAMAPAAVDVMVRHFKDTQREPSYYDLIVTGDLASLGHAIASELLTKEGYKADNYTDCGMMVYTKEQKAFSGASGCACCAIVTYGKLLQKLREGQFNKILVVATGALLSPITFQQDESIPCIAHAVALEN